MCREHMNIWQWPIGPKFAHKGLTVHSGTFNPFAASCHKRNSFTPES